MANGNGNGDIIKSTFFYLIEKVGLPTTLLLAAVFFLGRPMLASYQKSMDAQTALSIRCTQSLIEIESIVREDRAEGKSQRLSELRAMLAAHEQAMSESRQRAQLNSIKQTAILSSINQLLEKAE